ncbi:primosomal protein [Pseudactinotalea sp. HY160]|uniref:primosomal protein n=1 Tax=Pseudactinotalea sp. HY160 TaxID=2654490 RepID=UPI00128CABF9|nr:primosomal protein [Pseudactinotalea sp. HY160]MPV49894.1 primosomal protein [Pseudactinotalea sp. HY160]
MPIDPRAALDQLIAAFEDHYAIAMQVHDADDDAVLDSADELGDAFDIYDEALFEATGVDTPLDNIDDDDYDDDDDDEDDDLDDEGDEDDEDLDDEIDEDDLHAEERDGIDL